MNDATKNLQDELRDSAHRIWLAGLGALAAAGEEGTKVFDRLVDRGREYETRGRDEARKQYEGAKTSAEDVWSTWGDKLDESVTRALHRMGVPSRDEIRNLTQRVEELNAKVEMLKPRVTPASPVTSSVVPGESAGTIVTAAGEPVNDPAKIIA
ncbi:MAG TPA: phasin family protein [Thermoanaerobaculia bacterium]|nr:phasin family protein [Thermoanaerobaculia bacterium]